MPEHKPGLANATELLPEVFTDYLDLLLQDATETVELSEVPPEEMVADGSDELEVADQFPRWAIREGRFECLQIRVGQYRLLVPMDAVDRVDKFSSRTRFQGIDIPGMRDEPDAEPALYLLTCHGFRVGIWCSDVTDPLMVTTEDVLWRRIDKQVPWFIGTHKSELCRLFDPKILLQVSMNQRIDDS